MAAEWIVLPHRHASPAVRLICVPPAGGGFETFRGWAERIPSAELGVVELPGRGRRQREPPVQSIERAAHCVADAVAALRSCPTVFFGHGLGALIAFESVRRLSDRGRPPLALFVSGQRAPHLPERLPPIASLPPQEFIAEARARYSAISHVAPFDNELMALQLFAIRADCALLEGYSPGSLAPLDCQIVACGGLQDPQATRTELEGWREHTCGRFSVHLFGGTHAYLSVEREGLVSLVANRLTVLHGILSRSSAGQPSLSRPVR